MEGKIYTSKSCGDLIVIKVNNYNNVLVRFLDTGYEGAFKAENIRVGRVKDPMSPSVFGIGFLGVGEYKATKNGTVTKEYQKWSKMLGRCYDPLALKRNPTYNGCSVCDEWLNFQVFAKWFSENYPDDGNNYELDKDIRINENKVYSPSSCMFVTQSENKIKSRAKEFTLISPQGKVVEIYNMRVFCRENGLTPSNMSALVNGRIKSSRGWRLANNRKEIREYDYE